MVMIIAALILPLWYKGRVLGLVLRITYIAGIVFVVFSATPFPFWCYVLWFGLCIIAALIVFSTQTSGWSSFRRKLLAASAVSLFSLAMCLMELPYHLSPSIGVSPDQSVFVIGDSLSAGISAKERAWPGVLSDISHLKVINLAKPGATVETALDQGADITGSHSLIMVEIGGNDLLGQTDGKTFFLQLDKLLGKLSS